MMRSFPNYRPSLIVHAALAGALAFSATSLMAEEKLGNFEIQDVTQDPPAQQPGTAIQSPRDPATGQTTDLKSPTSSGDQPELQARTVPGRRPPSPEETALLAAGELLIHATVSPNAATKQTRRKRPKMRRPGS